MVQFEAQVQIIENPNRIRTALHVPQVNVRQATITKHVPTKRAQHRRSFFVMKVAHSNVTKRQVF